MEKWLEGLGLKKLPSDADIERRRVDTTQGEHLTPTHRIRGPFIESSVNFRSRKAKPRNVAALNRAWGICYSRLRAA